MAIAAPHRARAAFEPKSDPRCGTSGNYGPARAIAAEAGLMGSDSDRVTGRDPHKSFGLS